MLKWLQDRPMFFMFLMIFGAVFLGLLKCLIISWYKGELY